MDGTCSTSNTSHFGQHYQTEPSDEGDRTMTDENNTDKQHKHVHGYNRMLERVQEFISGTEKNLQHAVDAAKQKASDLGELTREESEEIGDYLKRDIQDAAEYMSKEGTEMGDWLHMDVQLVEARILDWMSLAVDTTKLELDQLAQRAREENIWMTGEITGPGTLRCMHCDHEIRFSETAQIPPCPQCGKHRFKRYSKEDSA
jgi:DNA polymerase elongation subunit (family B)